MTQDEWKQKFGERLSGIIKKRNISQHSLAKESGLSVSRINDYLKMKATPTIFAMINLADALDMKIDDLIECDELVNK